MKIQVKKLCRYIVNGWTLTIVLAGTAPSLEGMMEYIETTLFAGTVDPPSTIDPSSIW
jgi:hypothetical protein